MSTSDDRAQRAEDGAAQLRMMTAAAKELRSEGRNNAEIAEIMGISESYVRNLVPSKINWGYNCLTSGVHHGRPEAIWNIPLLYAATVMFTDKGIFKELVISRIYNDAMQFVNRDQEFIEQGARETVSYSKEWADRIKELAEEKFVNTLTQKVGEITKYYESAGWRAVQREAAARVTRDTLNPGFEPLHDHDTINLLCRIIGVSASLQASKELFSSE